MQFKDIIGQENIKQQLRKSVQEGRIPHARLLTGPSGIGKLQLAIAYAQYLACPHRTEEDSCGVCPSCMQFGKLQHPDLHFVFPIVKVGSGDAVCDDYVAQFRDLILERHYFDIDDWYKVLKVETKQGMIYEKESSEILRKLSLKSFGDGYKTMIIWLPEKMNAVCANKLLKILEEPPKDTIFLLISEQPDMLLPTIISRTQELRIPRLTNEETENALITLHQVSPAAAHDFAHIANGSYLAARRLAEQNDEKQKYFQDFIALMRNAWLVGQQKNYSALLELRKWSLEMADNNKVGREKQKAFLQYAQSQVRENYIFNLKHPDLNYQTEEERNFSTRFAPFIHSGNVEKMMAELDKAERQIAQNGNAKIIFFDLCLQMIVLVKK